MKATATGRAALINAPLSCRRRSLLLICIYSSSNNTAQRTLHANPCSSLPFATLAHLPLSAAAAADTDLC